MSQVDMVNHPPHYSKPPTSIGLECIEYTRNMPFCLGNAFKYVYRLGNKLNNEEDLKKAIFYINDAIEYGETFSLSTWLSETIHPNTYRSKILHHIAHSHLVEARELLDKIMGQCLYDTLDRKIED